MYSSMVRYFEDLPYLSHCRMDRLDMTATDRHVKTQVVCKGVCVVGKATEWQANEACHGSVSEGRVGGECVSRSGGRSGWRRSVSRGEYRDVAGECVSVVPSGGRGSGRVLQSGGRERRQGALWNGVRACVLGGVSCEFERSRGVVES